MKKIIKRTLLGLGIIVVLLVLAFGSMMLKMNSEFKKMHPTETGKVVDNIYAVKDDFSGLYLIKDSTGYVVIDCAQNPEIVEQQMQKLGISPNDVVAVFLTHTDGDHIGALGLFPHAKLYIPREEEQMINGETARFLWFGNELPRTDYTLVSDREVVQVGNLKIEAFLVPGHTTGMSAYLVNDKYLFTGDTMSLKDGKMAPIPSIFNRDNDQANASQAIIRTIPNVEYLFTAHWGYTVDFKKAME